MKTIMTLFLFAHGLVHYGITFAPNDAGRLGGWLFDPARAPLARLLGLGETALRQAGTVLWILGMAAFLLTGLAYAGWFLPAAWVRPLAIGASLLSLALLALFWHPWMAAATAIDIAILGVALFHARG